MRNRSKHFLVNKAISTQTAACILQLQMPMEDWLDLINAETEEDLMALQETTQIPETKKSIVEIRYLSEEEKIRLQAEYREKALHDEASAMCEARMKGFAEGFAEGFAKGFAEGKAEVRRAVESKMRNTGYSEEQIKAVLYD